MIVKNMMLGKWRYLDETKNKTKRHTLKRVGTCDPNIVLKSQVSIQKVVRRLVDQVPVWYLARPSS